MLKWKLYMKHFLTKFFPFPQEILAPFDELLKSDAVWTWKKQQQDSLDSITKLLSDSPVLTFYNLNRETILSVDASSYGLGGVLLQRHGDNLKPIAYCSRSPTKSERNWVQIEKELLAAVYGSEKFNIYLYGLKYTPYCWVC